MVEEIIGASQLDNKELIQREELIHLLNHYEGVIKEELEFFFKYLNFYIGLFSAILAGTLTGLLSLRDTTPQYLRFSLLLGPSLIIILSRVGYLNIRVYYRRYLEALVTVFNIKTMLRLTKDPPLSNSLLPPIFPSKFGGGFITQFNRPIIRGILEKAEIENWHAEDVLAQMLKRGDTLNYAKLVLLGFAVVATALIGFIIYFGA